MAFDPASQPDLRTARLVLRRPAESDIEPVAALVGDWEVARWLSRVPHPYRREDAVTFVERIAPLAPTWMIQGAHDGAVMGVVGLAPPAPSGEVEFGYWLGQAFWGRGFATEAARAVLDCSFADPGLPALASGCFEGNARSARVLGKLGFAVVGRSTRFGLAAGRDLPHLDMRLARDVWSAGTTGGPIPV